MSRGIKKIEKENVYNTLKNGAIKFTDGSHMSSIFADLVRVRKEKSEKEEKDVIHRYTSAITTFANINERPCAVRMECVTV